MADSKITALASISTATDPAVDPLVIVDVSDTSMAATGTTKKVTLNNLLSSSPTATGNFTITGALTVDTTTLVVDPTNDRVGIRTASPADIVEVVGSGSTGIRVSRSGALTQYATLSAGATGPTLDASSALSSLSFGIAGTTAVTINSTGNLVLKDGTAGSNGVGVTFPATQVASSDANCLDDYEEGTFTPSIGGTATYTAQAGVYTKVGRLVTASFDITILLSGTGNIASVSGLPFNASANVGAAVAVSYFSGLATSAASIYGYVNTSAMAFNTIAAGGGTSPSGAVVITNGTRLAGTAVYMV